MTSAKCSDILSELERWYTTERGEYLLQTTSKALQTTLETTFGYHLLQLGLRSEAPLLAGSRINHKVFSCERTGDGVGLVAHPDELPLASDSVDTVIVHNALEFALNPHRVLSEIQRVLTPQGQLLIVMFNPVSLLGVQARLRGALGDPLWQNFRPITPGRLSDWLTLLNFEVHDSQHVVGLPPMGTGRLRRAMERADEWLTRNRMPVGGLFLVHATKQVVGVHPPRRRSQLAPGALIDLVPKPRRKPVPVPAGTAPRQQAQNRKGQNVH
jgi:SAM-dependent methyltransferase